MENQIKKSAFRRLGEQYFKTLEDGNIELIRVVRVNNEKEVVILGEDGNLKKINPDILEEYDVLKPDGMITVADVNIGTSEGKVVDDVVICLHRECDMRVGDYSPFVVCRQNIVDFFYAPMCKEYENHMVGVSVSRDTCPENIDFQEVTRCNGINESIAMQIYMEDTIDSIIGMIKSNKKKKFDNTLKACYEEHMKAKGLLGSKESDGYCQTLEELLKENNFQYDFNSAFNVIDISIILEDELVEVEEEPFGKYRSLPNYITNDLGKLLNLDITNTIVVPFNREFSIEDLASSKYLILKDKSNILYIINYTSTGEYRVEDLKEIQKASSPIEQLKSIFKDTMYNKYKG